MFNNTLSILLLISATALCVLPILSVPEKMLIGPFLVFAVCSFAAGFKWLVTHIPDE